ncbi:isoprenoid synthase domain-containing protein [Xylariaceae sp. FL1272]|nr:isoprenoid synthase domain-containing protein [Xylariaceae sp. FL1272]
MFATQELREHQRSHTRPTYSRSNIRLKTHNIVLALDVPNYGVNACHWPASSSFGVLQAHVDFKKLLQPDLVQDDAFYKKCAQEVNVINLFFPDIQSDSIRICFTAWLVFVIAMDDILETLPPLDGETALIDSIQIVQSLPEKAQANTTLDTRIQGLARTLHQHCIGCLSPTSAEVFFAAACRVFRAHIDEIRFLQGDLPNDLGTYMGVRERTIALDPFFAVIRNEFLPQATQLDPLWDKLQLEVCRAAGLQNDLIGLEKDIQSGERLNAVLVLMATNNETPESVDETTFAKRIEHISAEHNKCTLKAFDTLQQIHQGIGLTQPKQAIEAARHIFLLCETHLKWCATSKRYGMKTDASPAPSRRPSASLAPQVQNPDSFSAPYAVCTMASSQTIYSSGIFHGLPTYAEGPQYQNLTAIVTGATGVSGYHMVQVLAASPRWSKIYCLSSRPPPDNFFADLGENSQRVEHLAIDFQLDPADIAANLKEKIDHVDSVFYHSYMHPLPKGDVKDFWANADEVAEVNVSLFRNFIGALQQSHLNPRRFMLQTGTKHYAFYLGPASVPSFESDPRVTLDNNFYYAQEDILADYCRAVGAKWSVSRPSYIIGAVRDGLLNHLLGVAIYATVQAHLKQPIAYPGDYRAWSREQVQSTGLLNAYFGEWLVLEERAENEAFNIHDGLSFTWERLWAYLGLWYQVDANPPEADESKYRLMQMPGSQTPRGHGPQATLNSTFSLLEWSHKPEVERAWAQLKQKHNLVLDPFDDQYRSRIFSFADSAMIGDTAMVTSIRKARKCGFFGTVDSYNAIFDTMHRMAQLKLVPAPAASTFVE